MTPEQAEALQVEMWRRLSLEERFRIVVAMIEDGFALVAASIRAAHPEYTPEEFRAALFERIYGYIDPKIAPVESASSAPLDCTLGPERLDRTRRPEVVEGPVEG